MKEELLISMAAGAAKVGRKDRRIFCVGACALRADGVLVAATNGSSKLPAHSAHAEARVLRKAGLGAILFVARVRRDGTLGLALPCPSCRALIKAKKVKKVFYSLNEDVRIAFQAMFDVYYP